MNIKKILSIICVVLWMSIIFYFSSEQGENSSSTSEKVCEIIVNIIDIKDTFTVEEKEKLVEIIEPTIRKLAHFTIYTIGGLLISNCVYQFLNKEKQLIIISTSIGVIYAISDEIHQLVVSGRSGNIKDVVIDSLGIITGIMFFLLLKEIITKLFSEKEISRVRINCL